MGRLAVKFWRMKLFQKRGMRTSFVPPSDFEILKNLVQILDSSNYSWKDL
jgi:hypothetical protein